jgi:hypothetical protein
MSFDPRDPPDPYDNRRPRDPYDDRRPRDPYEYRDPLDPNAGGGEGAKSAARAHIIGPAIFLIIVGALNLLSAAGFIMMGLAVNSVPPAELEQEMKNKKTKEVEDLKKAGISVRDVQTWETWGFIVSGVVSLLFGAIILAGGSTMLGVRMWGLGVLASVLALLSPGGCCIFGLVAGIWGLVALLNADVRAGFR